MKRIVLLIVFLLNVNLGFAQMTFTEDFNKFNYSWYSGSYEPYQLRQLNHSIVWALNYVTLTNGKTNATTGKDLRGRPAGELGTISSYIESGDIKGGITEVTYEAGVFWSLKATDLNVGEAEGGKIQLFIDDVLVNTSAAYKKDEKWTETITINEAGADTNHKIKLLFVAGKNTSIVNIAIGSVSWKSETNALSVKDNKLNKALSIYPNPATNILNVKLNDDISLKKVQLIDLTGKIVYSSNDAKAINTSKFARGLYVIKVSTFDGTTTSKKIVLK